METTTVTMDRWFLRCGDCLTVLAIDQVRELTRTRPAMVVEPAGFECGACGGKVEAMGRVHRNRFVSGIVTGQKLEIPEGCDERCTNAAGPKCECPCGAVNHGTGALVVVETIGAKPRVTPADPESARKRAEEYRAALAAARERIASIGQREYDLRQKGVYLSSVEWDRMQDYIYASSLISGARRLRTHRGRLARLASIGVKS